MSPSTTTCPGLLKTYKSATQNPHVDFGASEYYNELAAEAVQMVEQQTENPHVSSLALFPSTRQERVLLIASFLRGRRAEAVHQ